MCPIIHRSVEFSGCAQVYYFLKMVITSVILKINLIFIYIYIYNISIEVYIGSCSLYSINRLYRLNDEHNNPSPTNKKKKFSHVH